MAERRGAYRVCWGSVSEVDHSADIGVIWRIMLNCIFNKYVGGMDWGNLTQNGEK
jgi:hypothetical protein